MTSEEEKLINDIGNIVKSNPIDLHHTHEIRTSLIRLQNMHESLAKLLHESKIHPDVRELDPGVSVLVSSDGKEWFSGIFIDKFPLAIQVLLTGRRETSYFDYAKPDPDARPVYPWQKATEENRPSDDDARYMKVEWHDGDKEVRRGGGVSRVWHKVKRFTYL